MSRLLLLGAGASRGVSYANLGATPSPLDSDFFDLLQRVDFAATSKAHPAIEDVLRDIEQLPLDCRSSFERSFYTLHLRSELFFRLSASDSPFPAPEDIVGRFATAIQALLRKAHGTRTCDYHTKLASELEAGDSIFTFNYDLVIERSLRPLAEKLSAPFGDWVYTHLKRPENYRLPILLKLHGSSNWSLKCDEEGTPEKFEQRTKRWRDFDDAPGYRGDVGTGTSFPIFLPFWDKRVETGPWLQLWKMALKKLRPVTVMLVWGYSLPQTDVRVQQLLENGLPKRFKLCVVDISPQTRERWRRLFPTAQYWEYNTITDFFSAPPIWWEMAEVHKKKRGFEN